MAGDLHLHTTHSDGSRTPEEALVEARRRGIRYVSFVDHDTTAGTAEAIRIGLRLGITLVPGVEISAFDLQRDRKVHLLGYGYRLPATAIEELCRPIREARHANTLRQIEEVRAAGYEISRADVAAQARAAHESAEPAVLYKQHIMLALIAKGYTDAIYSPLYRKLFRSGGPAAHDIKYVDVFDALRAIHADGGRAVLAHPAQLDSWDLVPALVDAGLDGIELNHEDHTAEDRRRVRDLAERHRLFTTGGSDDHGSYGSTTGMGEIGAPAGALEAITRPRDELVAWACDLAREAGALARAAAASVPRVELKGGAVRDLVTEHDLAVERLLTDAIRERFPDHALLTEEDDHPEVPAGAPVWIIDPIDGTTNFVASAEGFAVSVAHHRDSRPAFGIVYDVMADELYLGIAGEGAWLNGVPLSRAGDAPPKRVADSLIECSLNAAHHLQAAGVADASPLALAFRGGRSYGSAALGLCRIARGTLDVYLSSSLAAWDYAAAAIVLSEAGGVSLLGPPRDGADARAPDRGGAGLHAEKRIFLAAAHAETAREVRELVLVDRVAFRIVR